MLVGIKFDEINQKRACAGCARLFSKNKTLALGAQMRNEKINALRKPRKSVLKKK